MDVFQRLTVVGWSRVSGPIPVKAILTRFGFDIAGPLKWCGIGLLGRGMRRFVANSPCVIVFASPATTPSGATPTQKKPTIPMRPATTATPTPATTPPGAAPTQKELNESAQNIYAECSFNARYAQFHDCRCIEKQYLDRGIMAGPETLELIGRICVNEAGVAAYYYRLCKLPFSGESGLVRAKSMRISNIEEHCTCIANAMAKSYAKQPSLNMGHLRNLEKVAGRSCWGK